MPIKTPFEIAATATEIRRMGAQNVAISLGKRGGLLRSPNGAWFAHSPQISEKNPIGAGDSMVGGMVWALTQGFSPRESLGWGVAAGAATASLSGTEVGSKPLIEQLFLQVHFEEILLPEKGE